MWPRGYAEQNRSSGRGLEPLSHVSIQLYRGRGDLDTITQVETISRFVSLRDDPQRFARAEALLEAVEGVAQDREPDRALHVMLVKALATLELHHTRKGPKRSGGRRFLSQTSCP